MIDRFAIERMIDRFAIERMIDRFAIDRSIDRSYYRSIRSIDRPTDRHRAAPRGRRRRRRRRRTAAAPPVNMSAIVVVRQWSLVFVVVAACGPPRCHTPAPREPPSSRPADPRRSEFANPMAQASSSRVLRGPLVLIDHSTVAPAASSPYLSDPRRGRVVELDDADELACRQGVVRQDVSAGAGRPPTTHSLTSPPSLARAIGERSAARCGALTARAEARDRRHAGRAVAEAVEHAPVDERCVACVRAPPRAHEPLGRRHAQRRRAQHGSAHVGAALAIRADNCAGARDLDVPAVRSLGPPFVRARAGRRGGAAHPPRSRP